ncbi:MAG: HAD family phosphatase [Psychroserpens sp.]|uniref:HAD family hydrolase n=1 Tax=Psychroserpens sp. TaxID=2020870 RepID=UPI003C721D34
MDNLKAVLFDFDGVIAHSAKVHLLSWQYVTLNVLGVNIRQMEDYDVAGKSTIEIAKIISRFHGKETLFKDVVSEKNQYVLNNIHLVEVSPAFKGFIKLLQKHSVQFGIASNASRYYIEACLNHWKLDVSNILGYEDYNFPKPSPEPYIQLSKQLKVNKAVLGDVLILEDSEVGLRSALGSGMKVGYVKSHHEVSNIIKSKCLYQFDGLTEAYLAVQTLIG